MGPLLLWFGDQEQAPGSGVYEALTLLAIYSLGDYGALRPHSQYIRNLIHADKLCTARGGLGGQLLDSTAHK